MASASAALAPAAASGSTRGAPRPGAALPRRAASAGPGSAVGRASRLRLGGRSPRASAIADGPDGSRAGPGPGSGPAGPRSSSPPAGVDRGAGAPAFFLSRPSARRCSSPRPRAGRVPPQAPAATYCLLRLEVNPTFARTPADTPRAAARLTVRASHPSLADGIVRALTAQLGGAAAPAR